MCQMVAVTNGERCQKRSVYLGTEARSAAPRRDAGLGTPRLLGWGTTDKEHPSGNSPCAGEGLPCLNDPAVPLRPAPERQNLTKTFSKAKTPMKMFSVLFSCMTHMASAIPNVSKKALNGKLLVGFHIIISPCFILS